MVAAGNPAGAQPPSKLLDHVTDDSAVLTPADRATVGAAIDRLYQDRHIQLWVVYVDNFNRFKPDNWADKTRTESAMGDHDVLLAVATNTKLYTFSVPPQVQGITAAELNTLQSNKIQPAVGAKNWSGAAVAAADGLDKPGTLDKSATSSKRIWLLIAIGVLVLVVVIVVVLLLLRAPPPPARRAAGLSLAVGRRTADDSLGEALSTAEARVRQISDYVSRHHEQRRRPGPGPIRGNETVFGSGARPGSDQRPRSNCLRQEGIDAGRSGTDAGKRRRARGAPHATTSRRRRLLTWTNSSGRRAPAAVPKAIEPVAGRFTTASCRPDRPRN